MARLSQTLWPRKEVSSAAFIIIHARTGASETRAARDSATRLARRPVFHDMVEATIACATVTVMNTLEQVFD
jgi:hypothetical protein